MKFLSKLLLAACAVLVCGIQAVVGQTIVSPVTVTGSVTTAGIPVEKTDAQGNVISSITCPSVAKLTNKTILDKMVADGDIPTAAGNSVVFRDGALGAYNKTTNEFVASAYYNLTYSYGTTGLGTDKETWKYDKEGSQTGHTATSTGVKSAGFTIGSVFVEVGGLAKYSNAEKTTKITDQDPYVWTSETWTANFGAVTTDLSQAFEGSVKGASPSLVIQ